VACAAALATLDVVESEGLVARAAELGDHLAAALREVAAQRPVIGDVRGLGLMVGVELVDADGRPAADVARRVLAEAERRDLLLLLCGSHGQVVRFVPPLVATRDEVDTAVGAFAEALDKAAVAA